MSKEIYEMAWDRFKIIFKECGRKQRKVWCKIKNHKNDSRYRDNLVKAIAELGIDIEYVRKFKDKSKYYSSQKTYVTGAKYYPPPVNKIIICKREKGSFDILVHEFSHALSTLFFGGSKLSQAQYELVASAASYIFVCQYSTHLCTSYWYYIGYPKNHGATIEDLEEVKHYIFSVFHKMNSLMQEY